MYSLTQITATRPKALSKRYDLLPDGKLKKTTAAALSRGTIKPLTLSKIEDLIPVLENFTHADALMLGVPTDPSKTTIVSRRMLTQENASTAIARTKDALAYPKGGALVCLDLDEQRGGGYLTVEEFLEKLYRACPSARGVRMLIRPSSSSHITRTADGIDLTGSRGFHVYFCVKEGQDIARAMKVLEELAWCHGEGWIKIAANGAKLTRVFFDVSVFQGNRIFFESGAICGDGLEQRHSGPMVINPDGADALDTAEALPPLDEAQEAHAKAAREYALAAIRAEADQVEKAWLQEHRPAQVRALGARTLPLEKQSTLKTALTDRILEPDFIVFARPVGEKTFASVTVKEILEQHTRFRRAITLDPLEPDYNGGAEVGILFLDGRTRLLHSMAHGGATYRLRSERTEVIIASSEMHTATDQVIGHMKDSLRFFNHGGFPVTVHDGKRIMIDEHDLDYMLSADLRYLKPAGEDEFIPIEIPTRMRSQLVRKMVTRQLPRLTAVLTHPTITAKGGLLDTPGYAAEQELFLDFDPEDWPHITGEVSEDQALELVGTIMQPFREFPFASAADKGTILAAVLTATLRTSFPTAPAIVSTGPVTGVGKSLLMATVATIASGEEAIMMPPIISGEDAELGKILTSMVMQGHPYAIFDNAEGELASPTLQAFLTTARYTARPLTTNNLLEGAPTRFFVALTGTNISFSGDMQRRVLTCRIDSGSDHGVNRVYDWDPQEVALASRKEIIAAVLSLVLAAQKAELPALTNSMGSFPAWERMVRHTLRYVERLTLGMIADPVPRTLDAITATGETYALHQLHVALFDEFGWERFTARDILLAHPGDERTPIADALSEVTKRSERLSSRSVGRYLSRLLDRPLWGLVLRSFSGQKSLVYRLEPHNPEGKPHEEVVFSALAASLGLPESLYGKTHHRGGRSGRIAAIDRHSEDAPVIARNLDTGEEWGLSREEALKLLPPTAT